MSFRLAQIFLSDAFPAGKSLPTASIKVNLRSVGTRLEREAQAGVARVVAQLAARLKGPPPTATTVALQIDAGYIRAAPGPDGSQWIAAVASKLVVPHTPHTHAHAYVTGYNP